MDVLPAKFDLFVGNAVREMGIPVNIKGYFYLVEAVKIVFQDKQAVLNLTGNIYEPVARIFDTTPRRVSSSISRAIDIGWHRCDLGTLEKYFGNRAFNEITYPPISEFITVLTENVQVACKKAETEPMVVKQEAVLDTETARKLAEEALQEMKMPTHLKGYQYLTEAIALAVEDMDLVNLLYRVLYPVVAKRFDTTSERVADAISYAIEASWDLGDLDVLMSWFGFTVNIWKGKPTNGECIALVADTIQRRMK